MKTSIILPIFILPVVLFVTINSTDVSQCSNNAPLPEVEVKNCDKPPCTFYVNSTGEMTMKFRAPKYLEHFRPKGHAKVMGIEMDYPLGQDDGCVGVTNTPCPIAEGEYVEYSYGMFVLPIFPAVSLNLEFSLIDLDNNKEPFMCFSVDLNIAKQ